jgi:hypothetical protein
MSWLYLGCLGCLREDGLLYYKFGHTNNRDETVRRHKRTYRQFYNVMFIPLPVTDRQACRAFELKLQDRYTDMGFRVIHSYAGMRRKELLAVNHDVSDDLLYGILRDVAEWGAEAEDDLFAFLQ